MTTTGAFLVSYKGVNNSDYDGTELIVDVGSADDAESCVYDILDSNDWNPEQFNIEAHELTIDELQVLAVVGLDDVAVKYLAKLEAVA